MIILLKILFCVLTKELVNGAGMMSRFKGKVPGGHAPTLPTSVPNETPVPNNPMPPSQGAVDNSNNLMGPQNPTNYPSPISPSQVQPNDFTPAPNYPRYGPPPLMPPSQQQYQSIPQGVNPPAPQNSQNYNNLDHQYLVNQPASNNSQNHEYPNLFANGDACPSTSPERSHNSLQMMLDLKIKQIENDLLRSKLSDTEKKLVEEKVSSFPTQNQNITHRSGLTPNDKSDIKDMVKNALESFKTELPTAKTSRYRARSQSRRYTREPSSFYGRRSYSSRSNKETTIYNENIPNELRNSCSNASVQQGPTFTNQQCNQELINNPQNCAQNNFGQLPPPDPLASMNPFTLQKLKMRLISLPPDCQRSALATYPFLKPYMIAASSVASCQAMANEMRNLLEKTLQQIEIQCANGGVPPESTQSSTPTNTSMIGKLESGIGGLFGKKL